MNQKQTPMQVQISDALRYISLIKLRWSKIALLYPLVRQDGKSACRVYYVDGSYDDVARTCTAVLNALAGYYFTKVEYARELSRDCRWTTKQRCMNMLFSDTCTVVPLIAADIAGSKKSRVGYLIKQHLYEIQPQKNGTLLKFYEKHEGVRILQQELTVRRQLMDAELLEQYYTNLTEAMRQEKLKHEASLDAGTQIGRYR